MVSSHICKPTGLGTSLNAMVFESPFRFNALIWGVISVALISFLSLSGAAILPLINGTSRRRWMNIFIALAVATLSSDAFLHILPQVLGIHGDHHVHNEDHISIATTVRSEAVNLGNSSITEDDNARETEEHHDEEHSLSEKEVLLKMSAVLLAVYVLYVVEFIASRRVPERCRKVHNHDVASNNSHNAWVDVEKPAEHIVNGQEEISSSLSSEPILFCGLRSTAVLILFGDGVHNFIDGIAIGASFAVSARLGLTTSIAVICHELPQEIGDFAVLLEGGLSVRRALIMNLFSALTAFGGLFVGLAAINIENAVEWLLALTAGMFLYVAWLNMLVHLREEAADTDPWYLTLVLQSIGFIGGFIIIFVIGWFEEEILTL
uniref:Zinc transporter ZIP12 n=3 Tax=Parascaris univalens TaxID=6257 RepID=A0A915C5J4_PARUN